ncbi:MAG: hypothetical protein AB7U20_10665 [Planctomycetaceae bacterium]
MTRAFSGKAFLTLQGVILAAFGAAYAVSGPDAQRSIQDQVLGRDPFVRVVVPRSEPLVVSPLYDRPDFVTDDELAAVLDRIVPRFQARRTKPNFVEHAVRTWGVNAEFDDPQAMSGRELAEFLTDHARYATSWGDDAVPLIQDHRTGLAIRFGQETGASVHHDHWLASLTEGGIHLDTPVYGPARREATINDVLQESLRDFRLDERETEWTAMAFGLWIPPQREWTGSGGRRYSFDLIARRLMRGHKKLGVCCGTHRVYSLMLLLRLDDEYDLLSEELRAEAMAHLKRVRDLLVASQWADGRWPSNWADGAEAATHPLDEKLEKQVIATGHHLEWLAIAPRELHPPDEQIRRAARWSIDTTTANTAADVMPDYTYYSHVGRALALWRNTLPADFWRDWQSTHPYEPTLENTLDWNETVGRGDLSDSPED